MRTEDHARILPDSEESGYDVKLSWYGRINQGILIPEAVHSVTDVVNLERP